MRVLKVVYLLVVVTTVNVVWLCVLCAKSCIENENVRTVFRTVAFSLCSRLARLSYLIWVLPHPPPPHPLENPDFFFAACNFLLIFFAAPFLCLCVCVSPSVFPAAAPIFSILLFLCLSTQSCALCFSGFFPRFSPRFSP